MDDQLRTKIVDLFLYYFFNDDNLFFTILSCASLPTPSETTSGMLLLKFELENNENLPPFGKYRLTFENQADKTVTTRIMETTNKYNKIFFEPGKYSLSKIEFIYNNTGVDTQTIGSGSFPFEIIHGEIHIFSRKIMAKLWSEKDMWYMNRNIQLMDSNDYDDTKEYLSSIKNYELWETNR
ncbi:MAG: hypothetical protein JXR64_03170 [Spirochaetales bacterium]|nr:hypothetical protein [Spirochaetales bacterium]